MEYIGQLPVVEWRARLKDELTKTYSFKIRLGGQDSFIEVDRDAFFKIADEKVHYVVKLYLEEENDSYTP